MAQVSDGTYQALKPFALLLRGIFYNDFADKFKKRIVGKHSVQKDHQALYCKALCGSLHALL